MPSSYERLIERVQDIGRLQGIGALLDWDQETYMPPAGAEGRAEQFALIAGHAHEMQVSDETRRLLDEAAAEDMGDDGARQTNLRETRRTFERAVKLPVDLVKRIAHESSMAKTAWSQARRSSRFDLFAPHLRTLVELKREAAERIGYETEPYDALMDEYEPGAQAATVENLFSELADRTVTLLSRLRQASDPPDSSILARTFPIDRQREFSRHLAETLHFDFQAGRADESTHPFCTTITSGSDVRITTRYAERFLPAAMFGTMHEIGHALYEQGFGGEHRFTPMAEAVSLGIHESQSRLWENFVGRSLPFWRHHYPMLRKRFPDALGDVSLDAFHRAINDIKPSLIRVEADELTYNLHIVLRFALERKLLRGVLKVEDVPAAWNEEMGRLLGLTPPDDARGCLQDIHWSMGAFGYFPTYTLGNLYAAQFFEQAGKDIPDLEHRIAANDLKPLLDWLRDRIHRHGKHYSADELVHRVTGAPLSIEPFMRHVTRKLEEVYRL